jgi:hypothetical protein
MGIGAGPGEVDELIGYQGLRKIESEDSRREYGITRGI